MREYRRVDDTVTMRLNRTLAQFRDRDRRLDTSARINPEEEACQYFWNDLVCMCSPTSAIPISSLAWFAAEELT